jgi:hypothetical protein
VSDLQCPAIVILTARDDGAAARPGEHVAGVFRVGGDGAALRREIDALADRHRGETVTVVAPAAAIAELMGDGRDVRLSIDAAGWRVVV